MVGGNTVVVIKPFELESSKNQQKVKLYEKQSTLRCGFGDANDYEAARSEWAEKNGISPREVLGPISGEPS